MSLRKLKKIFLFLSFINLCLSQDDSEKSNKTTKTEDDSFPSSCSAKLIEKTKNGDPVGYSFENPCIITKIGFAQQSEKAPTLLGLFEGANDPSFIDAVPLYIITKAPEEIGEMNYIDIKVTKSFLYIRYVGPAKSGSVLDDFKVYGTSSTEKEEDKEVDYVMYQPTSIPLVVINTEGLKEPPSTKEKLNCFVSIISDGKINVASAGTIKRRGNSTGRLEKGSYNIKFEKKQNVLDLSTKAKKWSLLANHMDHTLIRNLVAFKVSNLFGIKFTPECRSIDLVINGVFNGNYIICDPVEVHKGRVELEKMEKEDIEEPEVTGGYLMEVGGGGWGGGTSKMKSTKGLSYTIEYPDEDDLAKEQSNYIKNKINEVEAEVYEEIYDNIDLDSFLKVFLVQEFCANIDCVHGNYFITKEREDEKLYFGPIWDFDLALDNDRRLFPTNEKEKYAYKYGDSTGTLRDFIIKVLSNEKNLKKLKEKWEEITKDDTITEELVKFIDSQTKLIDESQKLNFMRWNILNSQVMFENKGRGSFEAEVEVLRDFIEGRVKSLGNIIEKSNSTNIGEGIEKRGGWGGGGDWGGWGGNRRNRTNNGEGFGGFGDFGGFNFNQ